MDIYNLLIVVDSEYGKCLEKLIGYIKEVDGLKVNFGVYEVVDVNVFVCGDGSVCICVGLMDIMMDDEVMVVVGYEIGYVIYIDFKDVMKSVYFCLVVKNVVGVVSFIVFKLIDLELGVMVEVLVGV